MIFTKWGVHLDICIFDIRYFYLFPGFHCVANHKAVAEI